jgi:glycosyltransferase involved in cell wall biosynthesis
MSLTAPADQATLAAAVADSLVVASDPEAREASIFYWMRGRPYVTAVADAVERVEDPIIRELAAALMAVPSEPVTYRRLRAHLEVITSPEKATAMEVLFDLAWRAECNSRIGYHLGPHYGESGMAVGVKDLRALPPRPENSNVSNSEVLVVVPFRERASEPWRLRNLLACLLALRDQSAPRDSYQVLVVETDDEPRWQQIIRRYADHYLFARKRGAFNKSWAVNLGVVNAPGRPEVICILDADVLPDRDFIARNAARFQRPGSMSHLTYRDMWCLDKLCTSWAIDQRVRQRAPDVAVENLRVFVLRRPPGCCVWVRASAYRAIGGMDERFEAWGGEDNDFAHRLDTHSALDSYDDVLLHMYHPPSAALRENGELLNADIRPHSWQPDAEIGDIGRFADEPASPSACCKSSR